MHSGGGSSVGREVRIYQSEELVLVREKPSAWDVLQPRFYTADSPLSAAFQLRRHLLAAFPDHMASLQTGRYWPHFVPPLACLSWAGSFLPWPHRAHGV